MEPELSALATTLCACALLTIAVICLRHRAIEWVPFGAFGVLYLVKAFSMDPAVAEPASMVYVLVALSIVLLIKLRRANRPSGSR